MDAGTRSTNKLKTDLNLCTYYFGGKTVDLLQTMISFLILCGCDA
jgi:hypothetical protein